MFLVLASALGAPPASAQSGLASRSNDWTVTPFIGGVFAGDLDETESAVGIAVGLDVSGRVALEGELGYTPDLAHAADTDISVIVVSANVLYHLATLDRSVAPYATVGATLARLETHMPPTSRTTLEVAVNVGGGVKVRVTARVQLRSDVRFIHVDNAPNFWRAYGGVTVGLHE